MQLLEREIEFAALERAVERAASGDSALVVLDGPAGIGKTRLLERAREAAGAAGMTVLSARAGELELDFPFGVVRQLLDPLLLSAPEPEREELLAGAAQLALPVLDDQLALRDAPAGGASYATLHGLYWLVANLAAKSPVLIAVDDAHWADAPSLRFLSYLARRLEGLPVLAVVAARPTDPDAHALLLDEVLSDPVAEVLRPKPLSDPAVGSLVAAALSGEPDPAFVSVCRRSTGGNPFLLRELLDALSAEGVEPTAADARRVPEIGPRSVARAVLRRLGDLPPGASELARAVAVLGDGATLRDAAELAGLEEGPASVAADALAQVDILQRTHALDFLHPVIRAAVQSDLSPAGRAEAHARAARLLAGRRASLDAVAVHLLAADPVSDPWVVERLREAASAALGRGAPDVAGTYLNRALAEPPPAEQRAELLFELGSAEARAGLAGTDHMREALELVAEPARRGQIALALGRTLGLAGHHREAIEVLEGGIAELYEGDRELELRLEAETIALALISAETLPVAARRVPGVMSRLDGDSPAERLLLAMAAHDGLAAGLVEAGQAGAAAEAAMTAGGLTGEENSSSPPRRSSTWTASTTRSACSARPSRTGAGAARCPAWRWPRPFARMRHCGAGTCSMQKRTRARRSSWSSRACSATTCPSRSPSWSTR